MPPTQFNDVNKVVIRQQIRTEYKVAFPHLYNSLPRAIHIPVYHEPANLYIRTEDPDLPAFYFDPIIHPISSRGVAPKNELVPHELSIDDDDDFELPDGVEPFLGEVEVETDNTADAIALWWAPYPYNQRSGRTVRAQDMPLVKNWYLEHCPPGQPVKVRVSYQKLVSPLPCLVCALDGEIWGNGGTDEAVVNCSSSATSSTRSATASPRRRPRSTSSVSVRPVLLCLVSSLVRDGELTAFGE